MFFDIWKPVHVAQNLDLKAVVDSYSSVTNLAFTDKDWLGL